MLTILRNEINCSLICVRALRGRYNGLRHGRRNERMPSLLYKSPSAFGQFNINTARSYYFVVWVWEPFQRRGSHSCSRKKKKQIHQRLEQHPTSLRFLCYCASNGWLNIVMKIESTHCPPLSSPSNAPRRFLLLVSSSHIRCEVHLAIAFGVCVCVWCSCYHRNNANNSIVVKMMATKFDASRLHPPVGRYI